MIEKPWGVYKTLHEESFSFLVKKITVNPGCRLSLQTHEHRSEHWVVIEGTGEIVVGENTVICGKNTFMFIPKNVKHRIKNTSATQKLVFVEVQIGNVLREDDIIRYEDDYNR